MAKIIKISKKDFSAMIKSEALKVKAKLLREEKEEGFKNVGEPTELKMNKNDKAGDSNKALVMKNTKETEMKSAKKIENPLETKVNVLAKEEGSDKKAATAVEVKSGTAKSGKGPTAGQHNADFKSKTGNPKKEVSAPFVEKAEDKMNTMDSLTDKETKTFVEAGAEKGGNKVTTGQHTAKISEKAPVIKDKAPIAKGIEIKENYSKSELQAFIKKEATKLAKKTMLEEELNKLNNELRDLI